MRRLIALALIGVFTVPAYAAEVSDRPIVQVTTEIETPNTQVIVREHPKTGKPYVSIIPSNIPVADPFGGRKTNYSRPDYRMLDTKIKPGTIPYEGPYSSRKKVYVFAATLATLGVAGGAVGMATASAATAGTAAATGGGTYLAAGSAVAGTATAASLIKSQPSPNDPYRRSSESKRL